MKYDPKRRRSESIRLKGYDYSQPGAYFVTICAYDKMPLFGRVVDGAMRLSESGKIAHEFWNEVPSHFPNVKIDTSVAMPNHVHAIIVICDDRSPTDVCEGTSPPQEKGRIRKRKPTLGQIVAYYKYQTVKLINQMRNTRDTAMAKGLL